jgi:hypothetical protein
MRDLTDLAVREKMNLHNYLGKMHLKELKALQ